MIKSFTGEFRFLSNFHVDPILYKNLSFKTNEHAYQWEKVTDKGVKNLIHYAASPDFAKELGNDINGVIRPDWEQVKLSVMEDLIRIKFSLPHLTYMLVATGDQELIEGNTWGDTFWGVCKGKGQNNLGKLLMKIRKEIKVWY